MAKLTDKQKLFCEEYLIDLNASQSAIRCGYSKSTAKEQGCRLLTKDNIQCYIAKLKDKRNKKIGITQNEVLTELKNFAYSDLTQTISLSPAEIKELPIEVRRMISSYEHTIEKFDGRTTEKFKLKFIDKMKAFEMLNRHIGFYEADNNQSGNKIIIERPTK